MKKHWLLPLLAITVTCNMAQAQVLDTVPDKGYHATYYNATVKIDRASDSIWGVVTMLGVSTRDQEMPMILQHAKFLTIDSIVADGSLPGQWFWQDSTGSGAYLERALHMVKGATFTLTTYYHGKGLPEQQGTMHWGGVSDYDTMMFAMGVGFNAPYTSCTRHWLPCYDLPDDKPDSVDLTFICRDSDIVASNGLLISNTVSNGWRTMHWHESRPIATYLLTFATGPYTKFSVQNSLGIPFDVYCLRRDSLATAIGMNNRVAPILAFYDSLFAPFPFEKVGYVVTPIGSMEHQTMISLDKGTIGYNSPTDQSSGSTVAIHELSHQWWGDRITCKTFDDAWLNEGFAEYCESLSLEHLFGHKAYVARQRSNVANAKSSVLSLHGAPTEDNHNSNYPADIYVKGAAVLGMLRNYLGDSIFFAGVRYYGDQHAYSTATSADLESAFEQVSGQDLSWFWKQWVYGRGYPIDTITWSPAPNGAALTFHQKQSIIKGPDITVTAPYFRMQVPVHFATKAGQSWDALIWMDSLQTSTSMVKLGFVPDTVKVDPEGLMLMTNVRVTELQSAGVISGAGDGRCLVASPNPNNHDLLVCRLINCEEGAVSYTLIDESGRTIKTWASPAATLRELLPMQGIPAGTFRLIARFQSGDTLATSVIIEH